MMHSDAKYHNVPSDGVGTEPATSGKFWKMGALLLGGSSLVLFTVLASSLTTTEQNASTAQSTDLIGLPSASTMKAGSMRGGSIESKFNMYGIDTSSPMARLALQSIEASNRCDYDRDVSTQAQLRNAMASLPAQDKAVLASGGKAVGLKASEMAGATAPFGFWDPAGLSVAVPAGRLLFYREVEIKHGRVCMLATLGMLVGESFHPLFGGDIDAPAIYAFQQTPLQTFWGLVVLAIAIPETFSVASFVDPSSNKKTWGFEDTWMVRSDRIPGDLGFDPLGLKPKNDADLLVMQNKELNNGRLAMIAAAGIIAQEIATGEKVFPG